MDVPLSGLEDELEIDRPLEEEGALTARDVLTELERAWSNEKFSPEILPHKFEYVDCMLEQLQNMEENLKNLDKNDIKIDILKIEVERIRFIITSYMRCRIKKIEMYVFNILEQDNTRSEDDKYLSENENIYALEFLNNMDVTLNSVLREMPVNCQNLKPSQKRIQPDLDSYVFLNVIKSPDGEIMMKDVFQNKEELIDELTPGSQHLLPYNYVSSFVKDGSIKLI